jgi:hypothetical protein
MSTPTPTYFSLIQDPELSDDRWSNDIVFADQLLDWCVLRFGTTSQGSWNYKQYSVGGT